MFTQSKPHRAARRPSFVACGVVVICASVLWSCDPKSLAPQDASIAVVVIGEPRDGIVRVTAFVRDTLPPHNTLSHSITVGSSVLFENLGAGFTIEVGLRDLTAYACSIRGTRTNHFPGFASHVVLETTSGVTDTVTFDVRCRSGAVALSATGLPPNDSAHAVITSGDEVYASAVGTGTTTIAVVPNDSVLIAAGSVLASDGFIYAVPLQSVPVRTGAPTPARLSFSRTSAGQGSISFALSGVPADTGLRFWVFARSASAPLTRDSALISIGGTYLFANIPYNKPFEVGLDGLNNYACVVRLASIPYSTTGGSASGSLTTSASGMTFVTFVLRCRSGTADIVVSGLPAGDSATVRIVASSDTQSVRLGAGSTRIAVLPDPTTQITPLNVVASDGRTYQSPPQTVDVRSRLTTTVLVPYTAPAAACPFDQPYAWYPLNGNANDSLGRFNGSLPSGTGAPTATSNRFGAAAKAFAFDGVDDRIDLGDQLNLGLPFSIAVWVFQPSAARQPGVFRSLYASDDEPNRYAGHFFGLTPTGQLSMSYGNGGPVGPASRRSIDSDNPIPLDQWVHLAATVRGPTDMTLYVNGTPVSATLSGTGGPILHSSAPARIGSYSLIAANTPWAGMLDEMRIYNCSLDAGSIAALYQQP